MQISSPNVAEVVESADGLIFVGATCVFWGVEALFFDVC